MSAALPSALLLVVAAAVVAAWWLDRRSLRRRLQEQQRLLRHLIGLREQEQQMLQHALREEFGQCLSALHAEALSARGAAAAGAPTQEILDAIIAISTRLKDQLRALLLRVRSQEQTGTIADRR